MPEHMNARPQHVAHANRGLKFAGEFENELLELSLFTRTQHESLLSSELFACCSNVMAISPHRYHTSARRGRAGKRIRYGDNAKTES